jgi:hypothetical protein
MALLGTEGGGVRVLWILVLLLAALGGTGRPLLAQSAAEVVPYVPTQMHVVWEMLALGGVGGDDVLYDLGSGDGRIPITAARHFGTRGVGFEIEPELIARSQAGAVAAGVDSLVDFLNRDLFTADLTPASVVMLYLSPEVNLELRPKLLRELKPGTRVVSHAFHMRDWAPDSVVRVGQGFTQATLYLWVVPARIDGLWQLVLETPRVEQWYVLDFEQRYQQLAGEARQDGRRLGISQGKLTGEQLTFTLTENAGGAAVTHRFTGQLVGGALQGTVVSSGSQTPYRWRATRFAP